MLRSARMDEVNDHGAEALTGGKHDDGVPKQRAVVNNVPVGAQ